MTHTLRPATEDDSEFVYDLKRQALGPYIEATWGWDEAVQRDLHGQQFTPSETQVFVVGATPVGCVRVRRKNDEVVLVSIYILPAWQSKGIGAEALADLLREAHARHVPMRLRVLRVNERAIALYKRHGFEVVETTDTHYVMRAHPPTSLASPRKQAPTRATA